MIGGLQTTGCDGSLDYTLTRPSTRGTVTVMSTAAMRIHVARRLYRHRDRESICKSSFSWHLAPSPTIERA